ncbi:DMT family transporter [Burkholderia sp. Bp8986]|uniref:EamA family transporter n=2 Tax=Burkholderia TaxID=32008 RepID=UPI000F59555B|nr:EamA family transporter [Burkholderia sp. Bp8986]RQS46681.1 EamA family transporter [Burkholderia sp. Bp8986]
MNEETGSIRAGRHTTASTPVARDAFTANAAFGASRTRRFQAALAPGLAMVSMCSVQLGAALSRPAMIEYGTFSTTWLRLCFAAFALAVIVRPPVRRYSRQRWIAAIALGCAMACMTLCFFEAVKRVPLGLAVAINFLGPLCVATIGVRKIRMLAWPALALAGIVLLARQDDMWIVPVAALVFPLGSALGWAAYILMMKRVGSLFDGLQGLSTSLIVAALVTAPFGLAESGGHFPAGQLIDAAGLAVLVPLLPYVLEMIALRRMTASTFGILMSVEPAIASAIGFAVLGQPMTLLQSIGTLFVIGASAGAVMQQ